MVTAAAKVQQKACMGGRRETSFKVIMHLGPSKTDPSRTKTAVKVMAVPYCTVPVATPVPNTLAESLEPRPHPKETPLDIFHMATSVTPLAAAQRENFP
jgi:hypothetical protein